MIQYERVFTIWSSAGSRRNGPSGTKTLWSEQTAAFESARVGAFWMWPSFGRQLRLIGGEHCGGLVTALPYARANTTTTTTAVSLRRFQKKKGGSGRSIMTLSVTKPAPTALACVMWHLHVHPTYTSSNWSAYRAKPDSQSNVSRRA